MTLTALRLADAVYVSAQAEPCLTGHKPVAEALKTSLWREGLD